MCLFNPSLYNTFFSSGKKHDKVSVTFVKYIILLKVEISHFLNLMSSHLSLFLLTVRGQIFSNKRKYCEMKDNEPNAANFF